MFRVHICDLSIIVCCVADEYLTLHLIAGTRFHKNSKTVFVGGWHYIIYSGHRVSITACQGSFAGWQSCSLRLDDVSGETVAATLDSTVPTRGWATKLGCGCALRSCDAGDEQTSCISTTAAQRTTNWSVPASRLSVEFCDVKAVAERAAERSHDRRARLWTMRQDEFGFA